MDIRVFTVAWPVIQRETAVVLLSVGLDLLAPTPLFEHLTFARKHWAKTSQPDRQPVRQEAIQQRSKGLLAMIYALFRNAEWVQGTLLLWELTEWTLLAFFLCDVLNMVIVKMWCYFLTLMSHGTSIALTCRQRRKWITVQPQSEVLVSLRLETELGNLLAVGCQAKVKNSDMHHCSAESLKAEVSQLLLHLIWLWVLVPVLGGFVPVLQHLRHADGQSFSIRKSQSYSGCSITLSQSVLCLFITCIWSFPVNRCRGNAAVNANLV